MDGEPVQVLWGLLTNPNLAYLLLIMGLWATAAAFYVPGTGLMEISAALCLVLAIAGLTQLPVNVVGALLIAVAMATLVVDLHVQSVALTVGAIAALVLGSVFLFPPVGGALRISPWLIGGVALVSLGFFGGALAAAMRAQRLETQVLATASVGQIGVATTPIDPVGTVQLQSELWSAVADEPIGAGEQVQITALEGLRVRVKLAS